MHDPLGQQRLQAALDLAQRQRRRGQLLDDDRVGGLDHVDEGLDVLAAEQLARRGCARPRPGGWSPPRTRSTTVAPASSACRRISTGTHLASRPKTGSLVTVPGSDAEVVADGEQHPGRRLAPGHLDAVQADRVGLRRQVEVVAGAHQRDDDAELERELAAQRPHPVEQVAAGGGVDQVDQVVAPARARAARPACRRRDRLRACPGTVPAASAAAGLRGLRRAPSSCLGRRWAMTSTAPPTSRNGSLGRPGIMASAMIAPPAICMARRCAPNCLSRSLPMSLVGGGAGDDQAGRDRDEQGGDLGDQAVADGQQAVRRDRRRRSTGAAAPRRRRSRRRG